MQHSLIETMEAFQQKIYRTFTDKFHRIPLMVASPGRINIIGEHTDYNDGFVMPASIDKTISFALATNDQSTTCRIFSVDQQDAFTFDTKNIQRQEEGWANYVLGIVAEIQQLTQKTIPGFDAVFGGNIPIGAGLSSSAALECSLAYGLNQLFDLQLSNWEIAKIGQRVEHNYVGVQCGIMDQFASTMGKKDVVLRLDCLTLDYETYPLNLGDYQLLLCNTNVYHSLASTEYNRRREECSEGVTAVQKRHPEINSLRQVTDNHLKEVENEVSPVILKRCRYILQENQRVLDASQALQNNDLQKLGQLLYASHKGMQHKYEISCPELDFLVDQTRDKDYILGARMVGGGFGGCTLNIIHKEKIEEFLAEASAAYQHAMGRELTPYVVTLGDGAHLLD